MQVPAEQGLANHRAERHTRWAVLRPPWRPGRTPTYGPDVQQGVVDLLKQSPEHFGLDSGVWRLQDVVTVAVKTGVVSWAAAKTFNSETVRRLLRKAGYVYLSAKWWITSDDPHYKHKKARRGRILAWARQDPSLIVVYQDESWFSGNPSRSGSMAARIIPKTPPSTSPPTSSRAPGYCTRLTKR